MKKFIIAICLSLLMISQAFSGNCLAPSSLIEIRETSLYSDSIENIPEEVVDYLFIKDKKNAEQIIVEDHYQNTHLTFLHPSMKKRVVKDIIIDTLIKYKQNFPDDISLKEKRGFNQLLNDLKKIRKKNIWEIKRDLSNHPFFKQWYLRAVTHLDIGNRLYKSKDQIRQADIWELPIWPVNIETRPAKVKFGRTKFPVLNFSLINSNIEDTSSSLTELIKDKEKFQRWLKEQLKFLSNKNASQKWRKDIEKHKTYSLAHLTGLANPLEKTILSDNIAEKKPVRRKLSIGWDKGRVLVTIKSDNNEEQDKILYVFHSLYNAIRSTYVHTMTTLTGDILLYQKASYLALKLKDSLNNPQATLFDVNSSDIDDIQALIGREFNKKWGPLNKEIWGIIENAKNFINRELVENKAELASSLTELSLKYNKLVNTKKDIIRNTRNGRIKLFNQEAVSRDKMLLDQVKNVKRIIDKGTFFDASKRLKGIAKSLKGNKEPEYYLITGKLMALAEELSEKSVNKNKILDDYKKLQNQIVNSQYFHQLIILYVDTFVKFRLEKNSSTKEIIEKTFQLFVRKNNIAGIDYIGTRAAWWARLNQFVKVSYSENKPKDLFDATSRLIRIIENRDSRDLILGDSKLLINKLKKTRAFIENLKTDRKFDHLLREDLQGIADTLVIDYSLNDDERDILLSCVLNEQRPDHVQKNLQTKKAA